MALILPIIHMLLMMIVKNTEFVQTETLLYSKIYMSTLPPSTELSHNQIKCNHCTADLKTCIKHIEQF